MILNQTLRNGGLPLNRQGLGVVFAKIWQLRVCAGDETSSFSFEQIAAPGKGAI